MSTAENQPTVVDRKMLNVAHPRGVPPDIEAHLREVVALLNRRGALSVTFLPNFDRDHDLSLAMGRSIVKGLSVKVPAGYEIEEEDRLWLHPHVLKGRSAWELPSGSVGDVSAATLSDFNCLCGVYKNVCHDEFGMSQTTDVLVVDTHLESEAMDSIVGTTMSNAYNAIVRMNAPGERVTLGTLSAKHRASIAKAVCAAAGATLGRQIEDRAYNAMLFDGTDYHVNNHALKIRGDEPFLMGMHPLAGFRTYTRLSDGGEEVALLPCDCGQRDHFHAWKGLLQPQQQRLTERVSWRSEGAFNTYAMRVPCCADFGPVEQAYGLRVVNWLKMDRVRLSEQPMEEKLPAATVVSITPTACEDQIAFPMSMDSDVYRTTVRHVRAIEARHPHVSIFNPKYVADGKLRLPKEVLAHVVDLLEGV